MPVHEAGVFGPSWREIAHGTSAARPAPWWRHGASAMRCCGWRSAGTPRYVYDLRHGARTRARS